MVNQQLVNWIKAAEAKGNTTKQIKAYLIRKGYSPTQADEAIEYTSATDAPTFQQTTANKQTPKSKGIKRRNPFLVFLFSLITLGIYVIYWLVSTTNELKRNTKSAPNPWLLLLLLIPLVGFIVMIIYYWKYSKAINELTGFSNVALFVLWFFVGPVGMILSQIELNKKAG